MADQTEVVTELLDEHTDSYLIFRMDTSWYALRSSLVHKVVPYSPITFIPGCPDYVLGIIHIRGEIESVIDLRTMLSMPSKRPDKDSRILIVDSNEVKTGIIVDAIEDILDIPDTDISQMLSSLPNTIKALASGEFRYGDNQTIILDFQEFCRLLLGKNA